MPDFAVGRAIRLTPGLISPCCVCHKLAFASENERRAAIALRWLSKVRARLGILTAASLLPFPGRPGGPDGRATRASQRGETGEKEMGDGRLRQAQEASSKGHDADPYPNEGAGASLAPPASAQRRPAVVRWTR